MTLNVLEPLDPTKKLSGKDISYFIFFTAAAIGVTFTFSAFQATDPFRTQVAGEENIFNASGLPYLNQTNTSIVEAVQGTIPISVTYMSVANRAHAVLLYAMMKFVGEAFGERKQLLKNNATPEKVEQSNQILRSLMRNGIVATSILSASFAASLAFLSRIIFDWVCEDPAQAKLAYISASNLWPGSIALLFRILVEQFIFNATLKVILLSGLVCLITFALGSTASILLGQQYGFAGMSWGFDLETAATFACFVAILSSLPATKSIQLFHFNSIGITKNWGLIPPILKFALIKFIPAFHEVFIPLVLSMMAANKDKQNTFDFNPALELYNYTRLVMIAFSIALRKTISQQKGAITTENKPLILNNLRKTIIYGFSTVTMASLLITALIYITIRLSTKDMTKDGSNLLAWYAGIGFTTATSMTASTILSMINNKLATLATIVSTTVSWLALAIFAYAFKTQNFEFEAAGPTFFAANCLIMLILAVPTFQLLNKKKLEEAIAVSESEAAKNQENKSCCRLLSCRRYEPVNTTAAKTEEQQLDQKI